MVMLRVARPSRTQLAMFAWIWLMVGFAAGTVTLLGPVRWMTDVAREGGWQPGAEDALVRGIILLYVALSFALSVWLTGLATRTGRPALRWGVPVLATAVAGAALGVWMSPSVVNGLVATPVSDVSRFTFGPYPERARFEQLAAEGYTGVVSLLHPAVVPFEPTLLARERELAEEFGVELIHAPMLPWVADNEESMALIRELAESGRGRYYVHCYLGRDRVGLVRRLIETVTGTLRAGVEVTEAVRQLEERGRSFRDLEFERGPIYRLDEGVYLTPYPTDEEWVKYVVGGSVAHVMSLLDPEHGDDRPWIDAERRLAETYELPLTELPIAWRPYDTAAMVEAVETARRLPRPLLVHAFRSDVGVAKAFRSVWSSGQASVRPDLLERPLTRGAARSVTGWLVVGPRPEGPEFGNRLEVAGVRGVLRIGGEEIDAVDDRVVVTHETDLEWRQADRLDAALMASLEHGGPWYVYGDDPEGLFASATAEAGVGVADAPTRVGR